MLLCQYGVAPKLLSPPSLVVLSSTVLLDIRDATMIQRSLLSHSVKSTVQYVRVFLQSVHLLRVRDATFSSPKGFTSYQHLHHEDPKNILVLGRQSTYPGV